jgi:hypothetical protein
VDSSREGPYASGMDSSTQAYWQTQADKFNIISDDHFPVNRLNLFYITVAEHFLPNQPDLATQIRSVISQTTQLVNQTEITPLTDLPSDLGALISVSGATQLFSSWQGVLLPHKNVVLAAFFAKVNQPTTILSLADVTELLSIRSLDAVVYATAITEFLKNHGGALDLTAEVQIKKAIHVVAMINDLIDSVIHLPEDKGVTFSVAEIFQSITEPLETKDKISKLKDIVESELLSEKDTSPLAKAALSFNQLLLSTLGI